MTKNVYIQESETTPYIEFDGSNIQELSAEGILMPDYTKVPLIATFNVSDAQQEHDIPADKIIVKWWVTQGNTPVPITTNNDIEPIYVTGISNSKLVIQSNIPDSLDKMNIFATASYSDKATATVTQLYASSALVLRYVGKAGAKGDRGLQGEQGIRGIQGEKGVKGDKGDRGDDGTNGKDGKDGAKGETGAQGLTGLSAYDEAVDMGFVGSVAEWLASFKGAQGIQGIKGDKGDTGAQGPKGDKGDQGDIVTNVKLFGAKGDGVTDDTDAIQTAFNTLDYVEFSPNKTYMIDGSRKIRPRSNQTINFKGATLKVIPNNHAFYDVIAVKDVMNVHLMNAVLIGDRDEHYFDTPERVFKKWVANKQYFKDDIIITALGYVYEVIQEGISSNKGLIEKTNSVTDGTLNLKYLGDGETGGEWGNGIGIFNSKNIVIDNFTCNDFWGDGLYTFDKPENVYINDYKADNNRRQGISVIGGKNIFINNPHIKNTNGTNPQAGIDIEPEKGMTCENIVINNPFTEYNTGAGINIAYGAMNDGDLVTIEINNHVDVGSASGLSSSQQAIKSFKGYCKLTSPTYKENRSEGINIFNYYYKSVPIIIENPTIINPLVEYSHDSDVAILIISYLAMKIGNILISGANVLEDREIKKVKRVLMCNGIKDNYGENIQFIAPKRIDKPIYSYASFTNMNNSRIIDENEVLKTIITETDLSGNDFLIPSRTYSRVFEINSNKTTNIPLEIDDIDFKYPNGTKITFRNKTDNKVKIIKTGLKINPLTKITDSIENTTKGSSITIQKESGTTWTLIDMVGEWTQGV